MNYAVYYWRFLFPNSRAARWRANLLTEEPTWDWGPPVDVTRPNTFLDVLVVIMSKVFGYKVFNGYLDHQESNFCASALAAGPGASSK